MPESPDDKCFAAWLAKVRAVRRLAAPSWVIAADLPANCRFLAGRVDEVGLLFFEAKSSLAYGADDLPAGLAALPLDFHLHLPLDLPWEAPERAAGICHALMSRCTFLAGASTERSSGGAAEQEGRPKKNSLAPGAPGIAAVLHPPPKAAGDDCRLMAAFLRCFERLGGDPSLLLLENTLENDLSALVDTITDAGMGVCPDLGHLLAAGQERAIFDHRIMRHARMLHLSAPGMESGRVRHLPLDALDARGCETGRRLCRAAPGDAVLMLELFSWREVQRSLPVLGGWLLSEH